MKLTYALAALLVILTTGCNHDKRDKEADAFFPDQKFSTVKKLAYAHSSSGARSDGMLYERHFDGDQLNALGKQKLPLMLCDEAAAKPMTVYLVNVGAGDLLDKRKAAVKDYVQDGLRPDERVEIVNGPNPNTSHSTAGVIASMSKTESGTAAEGDGATTGQPTTPSALAAPGK